MSLSTAKGISIFFDEVCELWDANNIFSHKADVVKESGALMQNSSNTFWRQVEQMSPEKAGWDMTGQFGDVIQQSYPSSLPDPYNDAFQLRADDFRDDSFLKRRAKTAVNTLSAKQNARIAQLVVDTGCIAYQSTAADYTHIARAETLMDELELSGMDDRTCFLKPVNHEAIAKDLAGRGTLSGRPEGAYSKSMVGADIAGFDVFRANSIPTLAGSLAATTVAGNQTYAPVGSITNVDNLEVPVDYRVWDLTVASSVGFARGDKVTIAGVNSVSLANKIDTGRLATFSVVEIVDGTTLRLFNKPISLTDGGLTAEELAYANVTGTVDDTAAVSVLNDQSIAGNIWQPDVFWTDDSVEVVSGDAPFDFMAEMDGFKVIKETLDNGITVYIMYQGSIATANLQCRVFVWYGLVNRKPSHNGIILPNFA
jgi:hypothetical protein